MSDHLSRFTPSVMSASTLEAIFVARHHLLDTIMGRVRDAGESGNRNQTLLVGPRGAGKTHLISLVYHRTRGLIDAGASLQVAWLPEDPWTIVSYRHLLAAIAERLEPEPVDSAGGVAELEHALVSRAKEAGVIVVLAENLDRILESLGASGQQQLRHFLQHECKLLLVATTTRLDRVLTDTASPFFGYFTTTRLRPFTAEEAREMLAAIAANSANDDLVTYLGTERAKSRIAAAAHLAGGQPRLWALLASALRADELNDLVELLLTRFDDLTPYYQEQLAALSPQQRLIVAELAETDHPLHVGALASLVELDQRSVAKALGDLVDRGWVMPVDTIFADLLDRRRTYYTLAEPLARLAFQIKASRGEPLKLIVDFLTTWFDASELSGARAVDRPSPYIEAAREAFETDEASAVARHLTSLAVTRVPVLDQLGRIDDALAAAATGDATLVLDLPDTVRGLIEDAISEAGSRAEGVHDMRLRVHQAALREVGDVPTKASPEWIERAERLLATEPSADALALLVHWLASGWHFDEAEAALGTLERVVGTADVGGIVARDNLAGAYEAAGDLGRAIPLYERNLAVSEGAMGPDDPSALALRNNLAGAYKAAGDSGRAIPLYEQNLADYERVLGPDDPDTLASRNNLAHAYRWAGDPGRAIPLYEQNLAATERSLGADDPDTLLARNNLASAYLAGDDLGRAIPLFERNLSDYWRTLGPDHPSTLLARNNLAGAYGNAGNLRQAISLFEQNLADRERVFGFAHPETLVSRNNLAGAYQEAGEVGRAIALHEENLANCERVLGPDHPHIRMVRGNLAEAYRVAGQIERAGALGSAKDG